MGSATGVIAGTDRGSGPPADDVDGEAEFCREEDCARGVSIEEQPAVVAVVAVATGISSRPHM